MPIRFAVVAKLVDLTDERCLSAREGERERKIEARSAARVVLP